MEILEIMEKRHSVRQFTNKLIEDDKRLIIDHMVKELNDESALNIQVFYDEPNCFNSFLAHYGKFKNANNYISLVGRNTKELEEQVGYFGEKLVLSLTEIGIQSCWVKLTHGKTKATLKKGEKEVIIIAFGYGETIGRPHKSKSMADLCNYSLELPDWFINGMKGAMLAPTAMNQQKFFITYKDDEAILKMKKGPCINIDKGIIKLHFELTSSRRCE